MSITVTECFGERKGSYNGQYQGTYTRHFDVTTSDYRYGPVAVRLASGIPQIGTRYDNGLTNTDPYYEYDHGSFVNMIEAVQDGTDTAWKVTVTYSPYNSTEFGSNPVNWKISVRFIGERIDRVVDFDKDGNPIANSAGDRYADPVTIDDSLVGMIITRNELVSTFSASTPSTYNNTINSATWNGFAAKKCKMGIIETGDPQWDPVGQVWYYAVTYPVMISRNVWRKDLLDNGYNALDNTGVAKPITRGGQPLSEPVPLDGSGGELAPGGTPVTRTHYIYDEVSWSGLSLDLSLRLGA